MYSHADSHVSVEDSQQILGSSQIHSLIPLNSAVYLVFWAFYLLNHHHSPVFDDLILNTTVIYRLKKDKNPCFVFLLQADEVADRQPAAPVEASGGATTAVLVPPHRVSLMWTAWVFFKSFFSSLIPEGPQGVAN